MDDKDIPHLIIDHNEQIDFPRIPEITRLMISGGKGNPYEPLNLTANYVAMMNFNVPTVGFCLGHEFIAVLYQAKVKRLPEYQNKKQRLILTDMDDPIFSGIAQPEFVIQKKHQFHIPTCPKDFKIIAHSEVCPVEIIRHVEKPIYGFQGHPGVSGKDGLLMMSNFLKMCGLEGAA